MTALVTRLMTAAAMLGIPACATTMTTSTTWVAPRHVERHGEVESVREVVHRVQGQPVAGAVAGALIGGLLFHGPGPATLFGATAGAAVGAAASSGSSEVRAYQIHVVFDDGDDGVFTYRDDAPVGPGERVVLTPDGLVPE